MKKFYCTFILIAIFINMGCSFSPALIKTDKSEANRVLDELIIALEEDDEEAIKSMFSVKVRNDMGDSLDEQINKMIDYFNGDVISYSRAVNIGSRKTIIEGEKVLWYIGGAKSDEVKTTEATYIISFASMLINKDDIDSEGLWRIWIGLNDEDYMIVGDKNAWN